jgi:hypothetical protein
MAYTVDRDDITNMYIGLCNRRDELLKIIGTTDMKRCNSQNMDIADFVFTYEMVTNPLVVESELEWAKYNLEIWRKYHANIELKFLNAQIESIAHLLSQE